MKLALTATLLMLLFGCTPYTAGEYEAILAKERGWNGPTGTVCSYTARGQICNYSGR